MKKVKGRQGYKMNGADGLQNAKQIDTKAVMELEAAGQQKRDALTGVGS
jgi:hypothetical protein